MRTILILTAVMVCMAVPSAAQERKQTMETPFYSFTMKSLEGRDVPLSTYKGKVVMVVNTASFCGYTPQYKDLEAIYKQYKEKGFVILGFPANDFGKQEPGKDEDIAAFCERNYGVTFPMFSKISVKGKGIHPLYEYLTTQTQFKEEIGWNFTKFVVDKNGAVVAKFESKVKPTDKEVLAAVEKLLAQ
ncbi:MAG: glutathione peroxidase [Bacteroidetes bacterium]|nr:glutathione peroxidase [Bacteroidota bacterium]